MPFSSLPAPLQAALAAREYLSATPVQASVLEEPSERDLLVSAKTGSGKTVAYGLAMSANLMPEDEFVSGYEARTGRTVNRRTLRFYRVLLSWSVLAMASMGLGAAAAHHNHQDALLTWLSMVNPALIDEITRLLLDEVAA
ncbi:MAG: DEAD/DEAH box helicase [Rhodospirillales bacterium]|nr:DEAD/DEAH box helicase [Rhodospirillales bacterium]